LKPVVLQLIDSFNEGGSERQAIQLTRLLHENSGRFDVRLASLSPNGVLRPEAEALELGEIPSYPLQSFYAPSALVQLWRFVHFLRASKIDILHSHDFYTNLFGMAAGKLARVPVRVASRRETGGMRTRAQARVQAVAYSFATRIVANSDAVQKQLIKEGVNAAKISIIHNGLNLGRIVSNSKPRSEAFELLGLPVEANNGKLRFVTIVANMRHDVKDYPTFLRAARRVHEALPQTAFLLAGEGELTNSLRSLATELGLADRAFFLGRCERVAELLSISDVCVLSSKAEGFSNSILEYMAAARPVVATEVGGAREAIVEGETGFLVRAGDYETMAKRIISLLSDPETARAMGQKGRRIVEKKFSCEAQLNRTEELYDRLLALKTAR